MDTRENEIKCPKCGKFRHIYNFRIEKKEDGYYENSCWFCKMGGETEELVELNKLFLGVGEAIEIGFDKTFELVCSTTGRLHPNR